ncbi:MAG: ABC transporter permease [Coriobacteriia bacterium]|nr:ABC transporter permease [Coriobacteriia bacterium]
MTDNDRLLDHAMIGSAGALLGALATVSGTFLVFRPNRVQSGEGLAGLEAFGSVGWALVAAWVVLLALSLAPLRFPAFVRYAAIARGFLAALMLPAALLASSAAAQRFALDGGDLARTSLGLAFWLSVLGVYFVLFSSAAVVRGTGVGRAILLFTPLSIVGLVSAGALDRLSIMVEYSNAQRAFWDNFWQHVSYTLGTTAIALVIGVVLGVWAAKRGYAESAVFGVLNLAQVMPALAFVGLLIVPMGWLRDNVPFARELGVAGIGWAPVFVVLLFYALFPITRNTFTAIRTLDAGVIDAARGMGMGALRRIVAIELPLAAPVVLTGVRIALVQTAAGAIIAALVGGGGLGRIVFYGVEQTAEDLVLLGVIPIVALGLSFDTLMRFAAAALERAGGLSVADTEGAGA